MLRSCRIQANLRFCFYYMFTATLRLSTHAYKIIFSWIHRWYYLVHVETVQTTHSLDWILHFFVLYTCVNWSHASLIGHPNKLMIGLFATSLKWWLACLKRRLFHSQNSIILKSQTSSSHTSSIAAAVNLYKPKSGQRVKYQAHAHFVRYQWI